MAKNQNQGRKPNRQGNSSKPRKAGWDHKNNYTPKKDRLGEHDEVKTTIGHNSPKIYNQYPIDYARTMVVQGPQRVGFDYNLKDLETDSSVTSAHYQVPGMLAFHYNMSVDFANNDRNESAINRAAREIFTAARLAVGKVNTDFEQTDIALHLLGKFAIFSYFNNIRRMYNSINAYSHYNTYMPYSLAQAMNFNWQDALLNRAKYQKWIENMASQINELFIPKNFLYFERLNSISDKIFSDAVSVDTQYMLFVPEYVWKYNPTQREQGPGLDAIKVTVELGENLWTMEQHFNVLQSMINAFTHDSDNQNMDTLFRAVFKGQDQWQYNMAESTFWELHSDYPDEYLQSQLSNMILSGVPELSSCNVLTDENTLAITYMPTSRRAFPIHRQILNSLYGKTDLDTISEATRLQVGFKKNGTDNKYIYPGLDYVTRMRLIMDKDERNDCYYAYETSSNDIIADSATFHILNAVSTFTFRPIFYLWNTSKSIIESISGDIRTITVSANDVIADRNETAVRSSLKIASVSEDGVRPAN